MIRRIVYLENVDTKIGTPVYMELGENLSNVKVKCLNIDSELDKEKFDLSPNFHIEDGKVVFEGLEHINSTLIKENENIKTQLLIAQREIIDFKFKQLIKGGE